MIKREFDETNKKITNFQQQNQKQHQKFATKGDLKKLATKNDLDDKFEKFKKETIGGVDKLLTKADKVCKDLDTLLKEEKSGTALYKRHDKKLEHHEKRIKKLEGEFAFD